MFERRDGVVVHVNKNIDATGADPASLARVEAQIAELKTTLPATICSHCSKSKNE
jgi:hypothetical protein